MSNLQWNHYIETITKKATNTLGFVQRNFKNCPRNINEKLYKSYVRPGLEYASSVWVSYTGENIINKKSVDRLLNSVNVTVACLMMLPLEKTKNISLI